MKDIVKARYEAFGTAGKASLIRPIGLEEMSERYATGTLAPVVH
jgi:fructose-bisphosphate aldolase class II